MDAKHTVNAALYSFYKNEFMLFSWLDILTCQGARPVRVGLTLADETPGIKEQPVPVSEQLTCLKPAFLRMWGNHHD